MNRTRCLPASTGSNPARAVVVAIRPQTVDFPFVPVIATIGADERRQPSSSSSITASPSFAARCRTGTSNGIPGLFTMQRQLGGIPSPPGRRSPSRAPPQALEAARARPTFTGGRRRHMRAPTTTRTGRPGRGSRRFRRRRVRQPDMALPARGGVPPSIGEPCGSHVWTCRLSRSRSSGRARRTASRYLRVPRMSRSDPSSIVMRARAWPSASSVSDSCDLSWLACAM